MELSPLARPFSQRSRDQQLSISDCERHEKGTFWLEPPPLHSSRSTQSSRVLISAISTQIRPPFAFGRSETSGSLGPCSVSGVKKGLWTDGGSTHQRNEICFWRQQCMSLSPRFNRAVLMRCSIMDGFDSDPAESPHQLLTVWVISPTRSEGQNSLCFVRIHATHPLELIGIEIDDRGNVQMNGHYERERIHSLWRKIFTHEKLFILFILAYLRAPLREEMIYAPLSGKGAI